MKLKQKAPKNFIVLRLQLLSQKKNQILNCSNNQNWCLKFFILKIYLKMSQIAFQRACGLWKKEKRRYVKVSTMAAYSLIIQNHLEPRFGNLEDVTHRSVQALVNSKLKEGLNVTTVKGMLIVLRMILKFGEKRGWIGQRLIDVKFPTQRTRYQIDVLSVSEEQRMLDYLSSHRGKYNLGLLICLFTGMRIGEVCALRWEDVDIKNGTIRIRRTVHRVYVIDDGPKRSELTLDYPKTVGSYRDIPVIRDLAVILSEYSESAIGDHFVISGRSHPTEPQTMRNHFKKVAAVLGLSMRRFHGLRHTFATRCVESKCDYKTLSSILGHSNVSTTLNLYVHPGIEQKRKCVEDMMRAIV